jgi:hypothetical protein
MGCLDGEGRTAFSRMRVEPAERGEAVRKIARDRHSLRELRELC